MSEELIKISITFKYVLAKHRYLPSCKSASEFLLYLWVVFIDLQDLVLKLPGVVDVYVVCTSHKYDSLWHYGCNSQYTVLV